MSRRQVILIKNYFSQYEEEILITRYSVMLVKYLVKTIFTIKTYLHV